MQRVMGSIPGLGTKTPHAVCHGQGNMKEKGGGEESEDGKDNMEKQKETRPLVIRVNYSINPYLEFAPLLNFSVK